MTRNLSFARRGSSASSDSEKPISETGRGGMLGAGCGVLFFGIFFVVGAALTWFLGVRPVMQVFEARTWPERPCRVVSSQVQTHSGDDGNTYSIDIRYTYQVEGRQYEGDRYNFMIGSSSDYQGKAAVVERYPPGTELSCRVDPDDPEESVISVDFDLGYLWGLFGLPFLLVGFFGLVWVLRRPKALVGGGGGGVGGGPDWLPQTPLAQTPGISTDPKLAGFTAGGPMVLSSAYRPVWRFFGLLVFAGLWNAMVVFLLWPLSQQEGGCVYVFLVIFGVVGLVLLVSVPHSFLAMFNPRPTLTLDTGRLRLGEPCRVSWKWSGATGRIDRLKILLEGQEEATYRRGTDTRTDKHVFARIDLVDTRNEMEISRNTAELAIPADTMHSFEASRNKIVWRLKLSAEIARWPDVAEEHKVVIRPGRGDE